MLIICIGIMAATAEWVSGLLTDAWDEAYTAKLIESIKSVGEVVGIEEE